MLSLGSRSGLLLLALALVVWPQGVSAASAQSTDPGLCSSGWHVRFSHVRCHPRHCACQLAVTNSLHRFFDDADEDDDGDNDREDEPGWLEQETQASADVPVCWAGLCDLLTLESQAEIESSAASPRALAACHLRC
jgi:hypothetical protein